MTVNTAYFDGLSQNAFVNLRGIKGTLFVNACDGRAMHVTLSKAPGQPYGSVVLTCQGEKQSKRFFLR